MLKSRHIAVVLLVAFLLLIFVLPDTRNWLPIFASPAAMSVTHTVLFQFKSDATAAKIKSACEQFKTLKEKCIHPTTKSNYILSLKGGQDNSPEGLQNGITHGFVVEFAAVADRDFYVKEDPAHQAFIKDMGPLLEKVIVVDFTDGAW